MTGLRERKKQATRDALMAAALQLAMERGLDNVRVEDIAEAAGVSPRTFSNYFSSKWEALAARHVDRTRHSARVLRDRPPGEPLWEAVRRAMLAPWENAERTMQAPSPEMRAALRLLTSAPAMEGESLRVLFSADAELAAAVAERTGTDHERDLYPQLVATAVITATQTAVRHWLLVEPAVPLLPLIEEAMRQLATGLPDPLATGLSDPLAIRVPDPTAQGEPQ
ncbi:TetR family transcriptional regulator [Nonomuraea sp. NPDC050022]|uniref:acyl-CoA-like ligand-binding transcription factor n=1 Tax=unclassified Nonomuraea TaxID=2593643 RepID=UPI003410BFBD